MLLINLFIAITTCTIATAIAFVVLFKNQKNQKNQIFFIISIALSSWLIASALANYSRIEDIVFLWSQLGMVGPPIAIASILYFSLIFPNKSKVPKFIVFLIYLPALIVEFFVPTKYNIQSVKVEPWGTSYTPGALFTFLFLMLILYLFLSAYILFKKYQREKPLSKMQIKYFLLASVWVVFVGSMSNIVFPLWGGINQYTVLGPSLAILGFNSIIAYSILRYRLLDIRIIIQEFLIFLAIFLYLIVLYFSLIFIFENLTSISIKYISIIAGISSMLATIVSLKYINNVIKNITSPLLFKNQYNFSEVLSELNKTLSNNVKLDKTLDESFVVLMNALLIEKLTFLLYDKALEKFISKKSLGFSSDVKLELNKNNALYKYLNKAKMPLISEELEMKINDDLIEELDKKIAKNTVKKFKEWSVYVCQPIIKNQSIIGIMCVGEKISGKQFSEEDLKLIDTFANQIVLVIENFLVFEEILTKKEQLEKNMNLMIGRELKMMELKKEIKSLKNKRALTKK